MFVKKDDDVSLTFFSVIPTIADFNAKSVTFIFFFNLTSVQKCTDVDRLPLIYFFFIIQQKPCFNARCALKREVFCLLGPGVH